MDLTPLEPFDTPGAWRQAGAGRFVPAGEGAVEGEGGSGLLWYARETFADVELEVEWRLLTPEDNSGVFLRFPDAELARERPDFKQGFEVQIDERGVAPELGTQGSPLHLTGALYRKAPARGGVTRPLGEWNLFHVRAVDRELVVHLNGTAVCRYTAPEDAPREGRLGLQNHHTGSRVQFRVPRVRRL